MKIERFDSEREKCHIKPNMKRFMFVCFGKCTDYIGPLTSLTFLETFYCFQYGMNTGLLYCSSVLSFSNGSWIKCRYFESESDALRTGLDSGLVSVIVFAAILFLYQGVLKQINKEKKNLGRIFLVMFFGPSYTLFYTLISCELLPFTSSIRHCIFPTGAFVVVATMTSYYDEQIGDIQKKYGFTSLGVATMVYVLCFAFICEILFLKGYYQSQPWPTLDLENMSLENADRYFQESTSKVTPPSSFNESFDEQLEMRKSSANNLIIYSSKMKNSKQESGSLRTPLTISKACSISKIIENRYRKRGSRKGKK